MHSLTTQTRGEGMSQIVPRVGAQIVGRERRERLAQLAWCGEGCFDSRRRVNSDVGRLAL